MISFLHFVHVLNTSPLFYQSGLLTELAGGPLEDLPVLVYQPSKLQANGIVKSHLNVLSNYVFLSMISTRQNMSCISPPIPFKSWVFFEYSSLWFRACIFPSTYHCLRNDRTKLFLCFHGAVLGCSDLVYVIKRNTGYDWETVMIIEKTFKIYVHLIIFIFMKELIFM